MTEKESDRLNRAKSLLEDLLRLMGFEGEVQGFTMEEGRLLLHVDTKEPAQLIGRGAQVLDALQTVVNRVLTKREGEQVQCTVDVERYRERRKDKLIKMALEAAERALRSGRDVRLPPLNSFERRIVHQALRDDERVGTESEEAEEPGTKRVVVYPVDEEEAPPEPGDEAGDESAGDQPPVDEEAGDEPPRDAGEP